VLSVIFYFLTGVGVCVRIRTHMHTARHSDVSPGIDRKLVDNFSHKSDVTSIQDPFTSLPQKTPFYFIIVFHIKCAEALLNQCTMLCVFLSRPPGVLPCTSRRAYSAQVFPDRDETLAGLDEYRWTKYRHICASMGWLWLVGSIK